MPLVTACEATEHNPDKLFELAADVLQYPEFVPFCQSARILKKEGETLTAELTVSWHLFRERFVSRVKLFPERRLIRTELAQKGGPLKRLDCRWQFTSLAENRCRTEISILYEFSNPILRLTAAPVVRHSVKRMVESFKQRADKTE